MSLKYSRTTSAETKFKNSPYIETKFESKLLSSTPRSTKLSPILQDTLCRITSPYKKQSPMKIHPLAMTPSSSADKISWPSLSPKKTARPATSVGKGESSPYFDFYPTQDNGGFPHQELVESDLKTSLVTLKTVMRDYEEKQKEKKVLQKVIEQLKAQTANLQAKKVAFTKNFEKLHVDRLTMNKSSLHKENERVVIQKHITQERNAVNKLDREVQEYINMNVEVAQRIKEEQDFIMKIKAEIGEIKKILPTIAKEKEFYRNNLQLSAKALATSEDKFTNLTREKAGYINQIHSSKKISE